MDSVERVFKVQTVHQHNTHIHTHIINFEIPIVKDANYAVSICRHARIKFSDVC